MMSEPTTGPLVCAPLLAEAFALRRSAATDFVLHTGYGEGSRRAAARLGRPRALAVAGVAAGVAPGMRAGDVVVATEVRGGGRTVPCPSAPLLAAALRRRGLPVRLGPVHRVDRIVGRRGYAAAADAGAVAVDLESADLAEAAHGGPLAVVRVVVDTPAAPLLRPATVPHGLLALRRLRVAGDALAEWVAAVSPREVLLAAPRSFCAGVDRAIEIVESALRRPGPPVYVRKQIVHNVHVVAELERRGAVFVEELDEVPDGARVIFSAHGVSPAVRAEAARRGLSVIDGTCPLVAKVHTEARRLARRGTTIALVGHAGHEEVDGTLGEAPDRIVLVQTPQEVAGLDVPDPERVAFLMQTTLSTEEADTVVAALRDRFPAIEAPATDDICYATTNRQNALRAVAGACDLVLVVGSANSSNSLRLVETAERAGTAARRIDSPDDIDLRWLTGVDRVGVTAGASAPPAIVEEVVAVLAGLGPVEVGEHRVATETVQFSLPREVSL